MKGLYLRHRVWWFRYRPPTGGAQRFVNLQTDDEALAIERARAELARADRQPAQDWTPEIDAYLVGKSRNYARDLRSVLEKVARWMAEAGVTSPAALRAPVLKEWVESLRGQPIRPETADAYVDALRRFVGWVRARRKASTADPFGGLTLGTPRARPRKSFLQPEKAQELIDLARETDAGLHFACMCALHAGLRKEEVIQAQAHWFDLRAGLLHVQRSGSWQPKDRDNRTIPMTKALAAFVKVYGLREPYMLRPEVKPGKSRYRYDFAKLFRGVAAKVATGLTFHDLRRTFASTLVSRGVSVYKVATWLGDDVDTVQRHYGHLAAQDDDVEAADPGFQRE